MNSEEICNICFEKLSDNGKIVTKCRHKYCIDCYTELVIKHNFKNDLRCPTCRNIIKDKKNNKEQLLYTTSENTDDIYRLEPVVGFLFQLLTENNN